MPNWASERPWFCTAAPCGAVTAATVRLRARSAAGGMASSSAPITGSASRSTEYATVPCGPARSTSVRRRSPLSEETETNSGRTGPATGASGPRIPEVSQAAAASAGAVQATAARAMTAIPLGDRQRPERSLPCSPSPVASTASSRPAPANASAGPGQARTVPPPIAGVTMSLVSATAATSPSSAADHPASTSPRRRPKTSATTAASTRPAVTQNGGSPGPPGDSSSRDRAGRPRAASPAGCNPASRNSSDGWVARDILHGRRSTTGTTATIAASITTPGRPRRKARTPRAIAATAITQTSGTKAAATATSRPVAQAARRARRRPWVKTRAATTVINGSRTSTSAVPRRPAATAPMPTGSSA